MCCNENSAKRNMPPLRGGTVKVFYCGMHRCQHDPGPGARRPQRLTLHIGADKCGLRRPARPEHVDVWPADSCARLSPYCSFSIVEYDISYGGPAQAQIGSGSL